VQHIAARVGWKARHCSGICAGRGNHGLRQVDAAGHEEHRHMEEAQEERSDTRGETGCAWRGARVYAAPRGARLPSPSAVAAAPATRPL
jgi:hypothetical protein